MEKNEKAEDLRKRRNRELLKRMHNGEVLCSYDSTDSWFPPRPIIKKDKKEMARLYNGGVKKDEVACREKKTQSKSSEKIVQLSDFSTPDSTDLQPAG